MSTPPPSDLDTLSIDPGVPLRVADLGQARAEPEIAFLMASDLEGPGVTAASRRSSSVRRRPCSPKPAERA